MASITLDLSDLIGAIGELTAAIKGGGAAPPQGGASAPAPAPSPSSAPQPTPQPAPVPAGPIKTLIVGPGQQFAEPADAINSGQLAAGFTMTVLPGVYTKWFHIEKLDGFTIKAQTPGTVVFDGKGGFTANNRLAWGKAFSHNLCVGTYDGIWFKNCGGMPFNAEYENQAGIYIEMGTPAGSFSITRCFFDGNNNGIASHSADGVDISVVACIFGARASNGADQSGQTHDIYCGPGGTLTVSDCLFLGNAWGNNIKSRCTVTGVGGGYNVSNAGRWIDACEGGKLAVTGGIYANRPNAVSQNAFAYAEENTNGGVQAVSIKNAKFYIGRYNTNMDMHPPGSVLTCDGCTFDWFQGANVQNTGNGSLVNVPSTAPQGYTFLSSLPGIVFPDWAKGPLGIG